MNDIVDTASIIRTAVEHRSPGLTAVYNEMKGSKDHRVLDLGPSSAPNFNFFTQLSCKIRFENLSEWLMDRQEELADDALLRQELADYLGDFGDNRFDLILTWDIFNYLSLANVEWLISKLKSLCQPGAVIHMIKYVGQKIPACPQSFRIIDQYKLQTIRASEWQTRAHANLDTARLLKQIQDFYMERSYLNHEGMLPGVMEQVLRFQPDKSLTVRPQGSEELHDQEVIPNASGPRLRHKSEAFSTVFNRLGTQPTVLDLGLKNRHNTDVLYQRTANLYTEDIYHELQLQIKNGAPVQLKAHMLNFAADVRFDLILVWDLLNFLEAPAIEMLFNRLAPHLTNNTVVHAVVYSGREMPSAPQSFTLNNLGEFEIAGTEKKVCSSPVTSSRLLKMMRSFRLEQTYMFQPGMQRGIYEYLFRRNLT